MRNRFRSAHFPFNPPVSANWSGCPFDWFIFGLGVRMLSLFLFCNMDLDPRSVLSHRELHCQILRRTANVLEHQQTCFSTSFECPNRGSLEPEDHNLQFTLDASLEAFPVFFFSDVRSYRKASRFGHSHQARTLQTTTLVLPWTWSWWQNSRPTTPATHYVFAVKALECSL